MTNSDVLTVQNLKTKMKLVQKDFMKLQNRSKLITVNPIFNKKEYLGINTEPLPVERYLIEIQYPQIQVAYKDQVYLKNLTETDIDYLVRSKFQKWMQFLLSSHFRAELNIGKDQIIPTILTREEKEASRLFEQNDMDLRDAMDRDDVKFNENSPTKSVETMEIGETRNKLNKWFPV